VKAPAAAAPSSRALRLARKARIPLVIVALGLAGVGALHAKAMRPLLARVGGCPVAGRTASPEQLEAFRVKNAPALKGTTRALAHPAFGFQLDRSTKAEVVAWGEKVHAECTEELGGAALRCERADGVEIEDAYFRFDPRGVLVGVDLIHPATDGATALRIVDELAAKLEQEAGAPTAIRGTRTPEFLDGQYRQAALEFHFTDYAADLTATNLGAGVVVREQYRSVPN
jgi:hypothetical protein